MKNIAIFASGNGTNAEALIKHFKENATAQVKLVIYNNAKAGVVQRAEKLNITTHYFPNSAFKTGEELTAFLQENKIDFIVLAGFLAKIPPKLIEAYPNKIVNIHPALLPNYGGKGMYGHHVHEAVIKSKEQQSGITIHFVNNDYDRGDTIFQATCPVLENDTPDQLAERVHTLEYKYFSSIVEEVIKTL